jgi:hypothetical protein
LGHAPIVLDRLSGYAKHVSCLLRAYSPEDPQLHDLRHAFVFPGEPGQCLVQVQDLDIRFHARTQSFVECNLLPVTTPFGRGTAAGLIYEYLSHRAGGRPEKMGSILPPDPCLVDKAAVCLMHEGGGLEGLVWSLLPSHQAGGDMV